MSSATVDGGSASAKISYGGSSSGITSHKELTDRDASDQHPISSITGLSDRLTSLDNAVDLVMHFKGTVQYESGLPDSPDVGDTYFVQSPESLCVYDGSSWDVLIDVDQLSELTDDEVDSIFGF